MPDLALPATLTRNAALRAIAIHLAAAGIETPQREARLLLCAALDIDAAELLARGDTPLGPNAEKLVDFVRRRAAHEPFARITGRREFYGLDFALSPATLVPRPDTETLVEAVLAEARARGMDQRTITIVDLGTGSGAILAALLHALPLAQGLAIDRATEALKTAQANIERLLGPGRARFIENDWLNGMENRFQIIVSNPPYIPSADIAGLAPEVAGGDPLLALDGGTDGLDAYRILARQSAMSLATGGFVAIEIGAGQSEDVTSIFASAGLALLSAHQDLGGHTRALIFA